VFVNKKCEQIKKTQQILSANYRTIKKRGSTCCTRYNQEKIVDLQFFTANFASNRGPDGTNQKFHLGFSK
jgi:hypothetical protein